MEHIGVQFGTTVEELTRLLTALAQNMGWDPRRVHYVIDIDKSTVKETVYAVSDRAERLPLHPNGASAVLKLQ
ncbi:MAG: hypothetical protein CME19_24010 [Gemmatimonadetes bacterium]|nr:hypothetical protein [Gemmatimonadota bacterium]|tara:strand:- start:136 stop:354 length:219 start_codon:yes stop_codon:yes gene_type:complete